MARKPTQAPAGTATSLSALTRKEVNEVVEVCIAAPMDGYPGHDDCLWGLPLLIEGPPGIAKTARIKQLAQRLGVKSKSLFAAQHPPEDFSGALIPTGDGDAKQICALPQVREMIKDGVGIIFLDEINGAAPATQGALQSFIHERIAGDQALPGRIRIIAAMNPESIATAGNTLAPAVANRFVHITDPGPNAREWAEWVMGSADQGTQMQADLEKIERFVCSDWPTVYPTMQAVFAGFITKVPSLLHNMPAPSNPEASRAWPSPRTWDYAMRAMATATIMEKSDTIQAALIEACVGNGAATAFLEYRRKSDIPSAKEVLDGSWKINPDRIDVVFAAYIGMVAYVRQRPDRAEKLSLAPKAWEALVALFDSGLSDIVVPTARGLIEEGLGHQSGDKNIKAAANKVLIPLHKSGHREILEATN